MVRFYLFVFGMIALPISSYANPFGACRDIDPAWYQCNRDEDCAVIVTPCGWPNEAAARQFVALAQNCNIDVGAELSCVAYNERRDGTFHAVCKDERCIAVLDGAETKQPDVKPAPAPAKKQ